MYVETLDACAQTFERRSLIPFRPITSRPVYFVRPVPGACNTRDKRQTEISKERNHCGVWNMDAGSGVLLE